MPGTARMPAILASPALMSPWRETSSLSKNRSKKCFSSTRKRSRIGAHDFDDVVGDLFGIFLNDELRKDLFERRKLHEVAQAFDGIVRHYMALVQNDDG